VITVFVVVVVAAPVLLAGLSALGTGWRPGGDWAVLALRVSDVGEATPLVGPYSRYGWNHPGPMLYWILAIPYRVLGQQPVDLLFGTALLNALALSGTVGLAWRRGRLPLVLLTGAALALLTRGLGPEMLRDPWNPHITLTSVALLAFLLWSIADGERWPIPVAVVVGSFLVQSHVGYVVLVAGLTAATTVIAVLDHRSHPRSGPPDRRRQILLVATTALGLVVCWVPVVVDQVNGSGNLDAIVSHFTGASESGVGLPDALGLAARYLAPWLGAFEPVATEGGGQIPSAPIGLVVPAVVFVLAMTAARWAGARSAVRFQALVGTGVVAGIVATSRITGEPYNYLLSWWWVVAALFWLSAAWSIGIAGGRWFALSHPARRAINWAGAPLVVVLLLGLGASTARAGTQAQVPDASSDAILGELVPPTLAALEGSGPILVRSTGSVWGTIGDGLRLELERAGIPVVADESDAFRLGPQRSEATRPPEATLWVVAADASIEWQQRPDVRLITRWDPVDALTRTSFLVAVKTLQEQLNAAGRSDLATNLGTGGDATAAPRVPGVDLDLLERVEEIRRKGDPIAVFVGPPV